MARVFVSYSSELAAVPHDESFVAAAADAVALAGHVPVYMKQFTAQPRPPADVCRDAVESCAAFVGLLGFRYGTPVREEPERSYMELEFDHAGAAGIPRLVFLLDPDAVTVGQGIDFERPELLPRQLAFRRTAQEDANVTTASFRTADRLRALVGRALDLLATELAPPRPATAASPATSPTGLPPAPRCEGRALLLAALVGAVTSIGTPTTTTPTTTTPTTSARARTSAPLPILGPPGIGKSTLAVAALHDPEVRRRFGRRLWFVRCDGAASGDALLNAVAVELGVAAAAVAEGTAPTRARVQVAVAEAPGLLVLDNLETPWHADPVGTEQTLRDLAGAQVTVVATIRGLGRPAGVDWREPVVVPPLGADEAKDVFLAIAGAEFAADADLAYLLEQCDGVPLALELLAANAQGEPDLAELTDRWRHEKAALMRRGAGDRRELSVPVSLELSIQDRTMTDDARRVLSLLGVLPDGMGRDELAALLPGTGLAGAGTLRRAGLAFDEAGRFRTLAPVREHVAATCPPSRDDLAAACVHYCQLATALGERIGSAGGAEAARRLAAVPGNVRSMIMIALRHGWTTLAADAATGSAALDRFHGVTLPGVLDAVLAELASAAPQSTALEPADVTRRAHLLRAKGNVAIARSDYDGARDAYRSAQPLYAQVGDRLGQSACMQGIGDVAVELREHEAAEQAYRAAIPLLEQSSDVLGQANCIRRLGDIVLERLPPGGAGADGANADGVDLAQAQANYEQALAMFRQLGNLLGEARCVRRLGTIALVRGDHAAARIAFVTAIPLYEQVADLLGHGNCHLGLGDAAVSQHDDDGARASFQQALELFRRVGSLHAIGWTHLRLARLGSAPPADQDLDVRAARQVWAAIGRHDLLALLDAEPSPENS